MDPVVPQASAGMLDPVIEVSTPEFEDKVMRASLQTPVIVDFWAPWCGPCKQLIPVLEKVVREAGGEVLLAKVNIDENQQLAAMLRIQSVPTVYAFYQGQPVDAFQGNIPESQVREFIGALVKLARSNRPDAIDIPQTLEIAAKALALGEITEAQSAYIDILQQDPENGPAYVGMVRCFLAAGDIEQAEGMIDNAPEAITKDRNFAEAKSALEIARKAPSGGVAELEAKIAANPKDHQARIDLALALFAAGKREAATDSLLESIAIDRKWNEEAARKELLKLFEAMGHADPVTVEARKKLSSILFS
ncbi:MAG: co-chaperone YbbN [Alphaproteobacteria bacterium]|nr:co-chaperone YbbN [Alphaproteobacteria bacterium]